MQIPRINPEPKMILALLAKIVAWLKVPVALALAVLCVSYTGNHITRPVNAKLLAMLADRPVELNSQRAEERQIDMNSADIKDLQRRMDVFEAMRIDASLAKMQSTIEYDHTILFGIAMAVALMVIGSTVNFFQGKFKLPKSDLIE